MLHTLESRQSLSSQTSSIDFYIEDEPMDLSIPPELNDFDDSYVNYLTSNYQELQDMEEQYEDDFYLGMEKETTALPSGIQSNPDYIKIVNFKQIMDLILRSSKQINLEQVQEEQIEKKISLSIVILIYELASLYLNEFIKNYKEYDGIKSEVKSLKKRLDSAANESFYVEEINKVIIFIFNKNPKNDDNYYNLEYFNSELDKFIDTVINEEIVQQGGGFKMFSKKIDDIQQKTYKLTYEDLEYGFSNKDIFKDKETEYKDIISQIAFILNYTGGKFEAKPFSPLRLNTLYKNRRNIIIRNTSQYIIETARLSENNFYHPKLWRGLAHTTISPYILMFNIANSTKKNVGVNFNRAKKKGGGKQINKIL